jgi:competence protein ComEC
MQYYGLRGLDAFILTHFDMDHIGGARSVVKGTHVRQLLTHHAPDLTKAGIDDAINVLRLSYPAKLVLDKHAYLLFYPFLFQRETPRENERSVICQLVIGDHRFLFTGDLESDGEAYLAATYGERLQSDIFKAGHHGSKTSSTAALLRYVQPEIAVVSVGERNRYGHPNKDVLARFESSGVRIYRTDRDGAIEIKTDGKGLWVKTYVP